MPGTQSPAIDVKDRDTYISMHNEVTWQRSWVGSHGRLVTELRPKWSDGHFVVWFMSSNPFSCWAWKEVFSRLA